MIRAPHHQPSRVGSFKTLSAAALLSTYSLNVGTDRDGLARVLVRHRGVGTAEITASIAGGKASEKVTFTVTTTDTPTHIIDVGPEWDCGDPSIFSHGQSQAEMIVPLGTVVEWVFDPSLHHSCTARIESVSSPAGATPFSSGVMYPGDRFRFMPTVAGRWTYVDAVNQGGAAFTVPESQ